MEKKGTSRKTSKTSPGRLIIFWSAAKLESDLEHSKNRKSLLVFDLTTVKDKIAKCGKTALGQCGRSRIKLRAHKGSRSNAYWPKVT